MTKLQWQMVQELSRCSFAPASFDKKFTRDMVARGEKYTLSEKQAGIVWQLHYRYRKQIQGSLRTRSST